MRSTKSIRRDILIYTSMFVFGLGCTLFFANACFTYLTLANAMLALFFLVITALLAGKVASYAFEHQKALAARYPKSASTIDQKDQ